MHFVEDESAIGDARKREEGGAIVLDEAEDVVYRAECDGRVPRGQRLRGTVIFTPLFTRSGLLFLF